jgi:hypothetical protein
MSPKLDDELAMLRSASGVASIDLESDVWDRIGAIREERSTAGAFLPVGALSVAIALAVGLAGGGLTAVVAADKTDEISAFSISTRLAPSTLLDGHG